MRRLVDNMSKDGEEWIVFAEIVIPQGAHVIMDEHYNLAKI